MHLQLGLFLPICISTLCWYWSSSINAIATQRLFAHQFGSYESESGSDNDGPPSIASMAQSLTMCQLVLGGILSLPFVLRNSPSIARDDRTHAGPRSNGFVHFFKDAHIHHVIIGLLHYFGCLFTNMGFGYGSASLVQVVKLLEPIETLFLSVIVLLVCPAMSVNSNHNDTHSRSTGTMNAIQEMLSVRKVTSTLVIVMGTSMLLIQKSMEPNPKSIMFAMGSGFCMSFRNVLKMSSALNKDQGRASTMTAYDIFLRGMHDFSYITIMAAIPAIVITLLCVASNIILPPKNITSFLFSYAPAPLLIKAVVFHCLYNICSITVLSLTSAPVHSLLNVGKRIANVLTAAIVFSVPLSILGKIGIMLAAVGAFFYGDSSMDLIQDCGISRLFLVSIKHRGFRRAVVCTIFCMVFLVKDSKIDSFGLNPSIETTDGKEILTLPMATSISQLYASSTKFVLWMYPFPPTPFADHQQHSDIFELQEGEVLICPYKSACHGHGAPINMADLTEGTFYHSYILDHIYYKLRHFTDFCHHIQAIATISLLMKGKGVCVRTLGGSLDFCDSKTYQSYNPYLEDNGESDLMTTNFPFVFLHTKGSLAAMTTERDSFNSIIPSMPLAPDLENEQFATYGPYGHQLPNGRQLESEYPRGNYNSGEDIQSMAGVGWYPFVSSVRDKNNPLQNYSGYYINNCLQYQNGKLFHHLNTTEQRKDAMKKTELLSMFTSEKYISDNYEHLKEYTNGIYPFGCRSTYTCRWMKEKQIKSYFSACLTLTSTYQGGILSNDGTNPRHNAMTILEPTLNSSNTLRTSELKTLILIVDVVDLSVIPESVRAQARILSADIPKSYPNDILPYEEKIKYCYRLLSQYRNYAKVIITSRIHVGLPAAALGTPVIFVSKDGWLPGGHERTGRVAGLLDVFHRVDTHRGLNWTFGDLSMPVPPNPGNHYADRFRASFWNRLRRNEFYADAAKMFGRIPLQRLGAGMLRSDIQNIFHFVMESKNLREWQCKRAVENVFYFHPNAKVYIHVDVGPDKWLEWGEFNIFAESGYDLSVLDFDAQILADDARSLSIDKNIKHDIGTVQVGLLLRKYGGVFLSKSTFLRSELALNLESGYSVDNNGNIAMMISEQDSIDVLKSPSSSSKVLRLKAIPQAQDQDKTITKINEWGIAILSSDDSRSCMEDLSWELEPSGVVAVTVDHSSLAEHVIRIDSECYRLVEEKCIYCDEIHWEFPQED